MEKRSKRAAKARHAQDAHRVLDKSRADMAQNACLDIAHAAIGIDEAPICIPGDGIDGEVAPRQILLQRHLGRGMDLEALVAARRLALGAGQGIFLMSPGMKKDRKILAHRPEALLRPFLPA